jgi:hypothetical protein
MEYIEPVFEDGYLVKAQKRMKIHTLRVGDTHRPWVINRRFSAFITGAFLLYKKNLHKFVKKGILKKEKRLYRKTK